VDKIKERILTKKPLTQQQVMKRYEALMTRLGRSHSIIIPGSKTKGPISIMVDKKTAKLHWDLLHRMLEIKLEEEAKAKPSKKTGK
jgi:hypothetical protein